MTISELTKLFLQMAVDLSRIVEQIKIDYFLIKFMAPAIWMYILLII